MATPTRKAINLEDMIKGVFGIDGVQRIKDNVCTTCGKSVVEFRDRLSLREYYISGMCQECRDKAYPNNCDEEL
jgi:hypothetical protein